MTLECACLVECFYVVRLHRILPGTMTIEKLRGDDVIVAYELPVLGADGCEGDLRGCTVEAAVSSWEPAAEECHTVVCHPRFQRDELSYFDDGEDRPHDLVGIPLMFRVRSGIRAWVPSTKCVRFVDFTHQNVLVFKSQILTSGWVVNFRLTPSWWVFNGTHTDSTDSLFLMLELHVVWVAWVSPRASTRTCRSQDIPMIQAERTNMCHTMCVSRCHLHTAESNVS